MNGTLDYTLNTALVESLVDHAINAELVQDSPVLVAVATRSEHGALSAARYACDDESGAALDALAIRVCALVLNDDAESCASILVNRAEAELLSLLNAVLIDGDGGAPLF